MRHSICTEEVGQSYLICDLDCQLLSGRTKLEEELVQSNGLETRVVVASLVVDELTLGEGEGFDSGTRSRMNGTGSRREWRDGRFRTALEDVEVNLPRYKE